MDFPQKLRYFINGHDNYAIYTIMHTLYYQGQLYKVHCTKYKVLFTVQCIYYQGQLYMASFCNLHNVDVFYLALDFGYVFVSPDHDNKYHTKLPLYHRWDQYHNLAVGII